MRSVNIPIFLSSDDNYAPFVATTIASICDNTKSFCEFYVLDGGIDEKNRTKIEKLKNYSNNFSIEFIKIDVEKEFKSIEYNNSCKHVTLSTYNRFLIPNLKPELKKVLYLDVDLIAVGDVVKLYEQDLEGYALGAIPEQISQTKIAVFKKAIGLSDSHSYFNAGVLLMDLELWRKDFIMEKLFNVEQTCRKRLLHADQDVLNVYFDSNYKILNIIYNFETNNVNNEQTDIKDVIIRHYNTDLKPWHFVSDLRTELVRNIKEFWYYAEKTQFYEELKNNCKYKTIESLHSLRFQKLFKKCFENV